MLAFFNNVSRQEALHVPNPPVDFLEKNYDVCFFEHVCHVELSFCYLLPVHLSYASQE